MSARVLVTGAGGFIGRSAVAALGGLGFEIHGAGRNRPDDLAVDSWHVLDFLDAASVHASVCEVAPTHLLHLAWCTNHGRFWDDPLNDDWSRATLSLARSLRDAGGARFVMAGSCTQYEWSDAALGPDGIAREDATPLRPATRYGRAKQDTMEQLIAFGSQHGIEVATGLIFFPYGPYEKPERLVPSVTSALLDGRPADTTLGTQVRDFVHVDDCGAALAALLGSTVTGPVNIGSGEGAAVAEVTRSIGRILEREDLLRLGALPERAGEPARLIADLTRLRTEVGFSPRISLDEGLRAAVEWWAAQRTRRR